MWTASGDVQSNHAASDNPISSVLMVHSTMRRKKKDTWTSSQKGQVSLPTLPPYLATRCGAPFCIRHC